MEVVIALPFIILPLLVPIITGLMAVSMGRKFWPWFFSAFLLPFISCIILLCLDDKKKKAVVTVPVPDEEIFDPQQLVTKKNKQDAIYFSAKA